MRQDFKYVWFNHITKVLRKNHEILFVSDPTQNIYEIDTDAVEKIIDKKSKLEGASFKGLGLGFSGRWIELKDSYRLPQKVEKSLMCLRDSKCLNIRQQFIPNTDGNIFEQTELPLSPECILSWSKVNCTTDIPLKVFDIVSKIEVDKDSRRKTHLSMYDTVILVPTKKIGAEIYDQFSETKFKCNIAFDPKKPGEQGRENKLKFDLKGGYSYSRYIALKVGMQRHYSSS